MASLSIAPHRIERKAGTGPLARSHMHRQRRVWPVALLLRFRSTARRGGSKPPRGLMKKVSLLRAGRSYYNGFIPAVASDVVMGGGFHPIYIHRSGYIGGLLACGSRRRFSVVGDDRPPPSAASDACANSGRGILSSTALALGERGIASAIDGLGPVRSQSGFLFLYKSASASGIANAQSYNVYKRFNGLWDTSALTPLVQSFKQRHYRIPPESAARLIRNDKVSSALAKLASCDLGLCSYLSFLSYQPRRM